MSAPDRPGGIVLSNEPLRWPFTGTTFTAPAPVNAGTSTETIAVTAEISVVATGGLCKSSTEKLLALANELVPYWAARTAEVAAIVQVRPFWDAVMDVISAMPVKSKSTPSTVERVVQSMGRTEVSVNVSDLTVEVGLEAARVRVFLLPLTTIAELPDRENWLPIWGSVSVAWLPTASEMLPPLKVSEDELE